MTKKDLFELATKFQRRTLFLKDTATKLYCHMFWSVDILSLFVVTKNAQFMHEIHVSNKEFITVIKQICVRSGQIFSGQILSK